MQKAESSCDTQISLPCKYHLLPGFSWHPVTPESPAHGIKMKSIHLPALHESTSAEICLFAIVLQHLSLHYNNLSGGGGGWKMNHFLWHHFITLFHSEKHQSFRSREEKWRQKNNCLMKPPAEGGVLPHGQSAFVHTTRSWPQKLLNHRKIEASGLLCWGNSNS